MRRHLVLAVTCLTLTGCVSMDASECRGANWYDVGFRDGLAGLQRMDIVYDDQCSKHGAKVDTATYAKGWQEGKWEDDSRRRRGGS